MNYKASTKKQKRIGIISKPTVRKKWNHKKYSINPKEGVGTKEEKWNKLTKIARWQIQRQPCDKCLFIIKTLRKLKEVNILNVIEASTKTQSQHHP